jgi:hypothetical protein
LYYDFERQLSVLSHAFDGDVNETISWRAPQPALMEQVVDGVVADPE